MVFVVFELGPVNGILNKKIYRFLKYWGQTVWENETFRAEIFGMYDLNLSMFVLIWSFDFVTQSFRFNEIRPI